MWRVTALPHLINTNARRNGNPCPARARLHAPAQDCDCCSVAPLMASGLVSGDVFVHKYHSAGDPAPGGCGADNPGGLADDYDAATLTAAAQRQQRGASSSAAAAGCGSSSGKVSAEQALHRRGKGGSSCRAVRFATDGSSVICGYESGSIQLLDLETGKLAARLAKAHDAGISRLLAVDGGARGAAAALVVAGEGAARASPFGNTHRLRGLVLEPVH